MGYNLGIGEFTVETYPEDRRCRPSVGTIELSEAPLNSSDNRTNWCWPNYLTWHHFCNTVGLAEVFYCGARGSDLPSEWFDSDGVPHPGLLREHAGCEPLTEGHYEAFVDARDCYHRQSQEQNDALKKDWPDLIRNDYQAKRLDWLVFWTRWALDNCKYPSFANS